MKALVLSGGGALGAFEAGVIQSLHDAGSAFDLICGTSIGAINASFAAQDKIDQLSSIWHKISTLDPPVIDYIPQVHFAIDLSDELEKVAHFNPFGIAPLAERWMQLGSKKALFALRGFVKPDAIEILLAANLKFVDLKRSLIITGTDLTRGLSEAFYAFVGPEGGSAQAAFTKAFANAAHALSDDIDFALAVRASAAIPGAFEPVTMNLGTVGDKEFVDGGVANNVPVTLAAFAGATDITVVLLQPATTEAPTYATTNLVDIGFASLTVMQQQLLQQDMNRANSFPNVTIQFIRPAAPLPLTLLGFDNQPSIDQAFEAGVAAAKAPNHLTKM